MFFFRLSHTACGEIILPTEESIIKTDIFGTLKDIKAMTKLPI